MARILIALVLLSLSSASLGQPEALIHQADSGNVNTTSTIASYLDAAGNYWVSTEDGLAVNDGRTWHDLSTFPAFHNRIIRYIADGTSGIVWFGTGYELIRLDTRLNDFRIYSFKDGTLPAERHQEVLADREGNAYIVAQADVFKLAPGASGFVKHVSFGGPETPVSFVSLVGDALFASVYGAGVYRSALAGDPSPTLVASDATASSAYRIIRCGGYFAAPYQDGFAVYSRDFDLVDQKEAAHAVSVSCNADTGEIYFGGESIVTWSPDSRQFKAFGRVTDIHDYPWLNVHVLKGKGVWASSFTGKTYFAAFKPVAEYHPISSVQRVNQVIEIGNTGDLVIGTNAGLLRYVHTTGEYRVLSEGLEIHTAGRNEKGLWAGGDSAISFIDNAGQVTTLANPPDVDTSATRVIAIKDGVIASYPVHGIYIHQQGQWSSFIPIPEQIKSGFPSYLWILYAESEDVLHVQTHGRGVYRVTRSKGLAERITTDISALNYQPARAVSFVENEIFVSTDGGLVYRYQPSTLSYELVKNTPRASRCITKNASGYLYVSANHGVLFETPLRAMYLQDGQFGVPTGDITGDSCAKVGESSFAVTTRNGFMVLTPENAVPIANDPIDVTFIEINGVKQFVGNALTVEGPVRSAKIWVSSRNPVAANVGVKFAQINGEPVQQVASTTAAIELFELNTGRNQIRISGDAQMASARDLLTLNVHAPWYLNRYFHLGLVSLITLLTVVLIVHYLKFLKAKARFQGLEETHAFLVHELRSPLSNLIADAEANADPKEQNELGMLRYMRSLVDESLDRLRIESGLSVYLEQRLATGNETFTSTPAAIDIAVGSVQQLFKKSEARLQVCVSDDLSAVQTPAGLVERLLFNVLSNAAKASPKGEVELTVSINHEALTIAVQDSGKRATVEESKWLGTGFGTKLMDRLCQSVEASLRITDNAHGRLVEIAIPSKVLRRGQYKLLLVDDDVTFLQRLAQRISSGFDCQVVTAMTLSEALQALQRDPTFTMIVTDWRLGEETANRIVEEGKKRGIKTVILHGGALSTAIAGVIELDKVMGLEAIISGLSQHGLPLQA